MDENTRCDGRGDSDGGKGAYDGADERWRALQDHAIRERRIKENTQSE